MLCFKMSFSQFLSILLYIYFLFIVQKKGFIVKCLKPKIDYYHVTVQHRLQQKKIRIPTEPVETVLQPMNSSSETSLNRSRTWSRSPYASAGPGVPVYGDTSVLPDSSFSPTSSRTHSRFL